MSEVYSSTLVNNYNLSTTFIVKSLVGLLLINSLFSGVDFYQIGLMKGLSSIADFCLKIILVFVLLVLFKMRSFNLVKIFFFAFMLFIGAVIGAFYHGAEYDKTFALLLNMLLWFVIFGYAKELEHNFDIYRFSVKISSLFLGITLILYIMAKFGFHVKVLDGAWLYDENFRFAGTFSEPSLNGYFYGLMFLMVILSNQKYRLILAFMFAITTYISGAKFSFLIIPVLLGLVYFFKVKGFYNYTYQFIPLSFIVLFVSLAFIYYDLFALIAAHLSNPATMTYVTRLGFPIVSIWHLSDYPLGSGVYGFKSTLSPFIQNYCQALSGLDVNCSEMRSYISSDDPSAYENFAPKDVLSFIILSFGLPGLLMFALSISLLSARLKENKNYFIILMYIVASMLFTLPFRFILFYSFFMFQCYIYRMPSNK
ncbi:O88 family O-antigen polymerase [Escherichia albertii]|nr:O88 family O-antigen polymerase [Escherichia albertii]EKB0156716.1 O88 family O-antigen polymerase [Escherichia albertii]MCZ9235064.1 O88 family O-antigen polymerase [Escherichia albertii]MCZ9249430.1 O88 family O-antigen polymerase [Escherichia albertii]